MKDREPRTEISIPPEDRHWLFREGNSAATTHGARSEKIVLARARQEFERLVGEHPQLADFPDETLSYSVSYSVWSLYAEAIDRLGVMDESDEPRASLSKQLRLWASKCVEHRSRLGLTPVSAARMPESQATLARERSEYLAKFMETWPELERKMLPMRFHPDGTRKVITDTGSEEQ